MPARKKPTPSHLPRSNGDRDWQPAEQNLRLTNETVVEANRDQMVSKALDAKLARIHADPRGAKDFILADAKDADMALSIGAPGRSPEAHGGEVRYRTLQEFRAIIQQIVEQGLIDIMLMSAHTNEILNIDKRIFDQSHVT